MSVRVRAIHSIHNKTSVYLHCGLAQTASKRNNIGLAESQQYVKRCLPRKTVCQQVHGRFTVRQRGQRNNGILMASTVTVEKIVDGVIDVFGLTIKSAR